MSLRRGAGGGEAAQDEQPEGAGQADEQASHPDGARGDGIVEEAADERGESAGETPSKPVDGHVTTPQVCGSAIGNVFGGGGNKGEFAEGQDDHAQPEPPETAHERHAARPEGIDQHASC